MFVAGSSSTSPRELTSITWVLDPLRIRSRPICPRVRADSTRRAQDGPSTVAEEKALDKAPAAASTAAVRVASAIPVWAAAS